MSRNKEHRGTAFGGAPNGAAAEGGASFIFLYYECLWILLIYSLYISCLYVLNIFHIFSFVCFLMYGVNSSKNHEFA